MARDNEYLTSNRRIRYPFSDDSVLPVSDSLALSVFGCFVDAMVQLKSPYTETKPKIRGISIRSHTIRFSLIGDAESHEEDVHMTCSRSTTRFPVITGESSWCWYTFVLSSDGIREYEELDEKIGDISASALNLSTRCIGVESLGVSSIWIYGGEGRNALGKLYTREEALLLDPDIIVSGDTGLKAGYNMRFSEEDDSFSLNAIPGAGMGYAPCGCEKSDVQFKMPGLLSPDGHSRFFNDNCYDLIPNKYSDEEGTLSFNVKCKACCSCEMYADLVNKRLLPISERILGSRSSLYTSLDLYEKNVAKWNERISTAKPVDIVVTSAAVPLDAAATDLKNSGSVYGKMNRCGFSVMVRNDSFVSVDIELSKFSSNGKPFEAQLSYMKSESEPTILPIDLEGTKSHSVRVSLAPGRSAVLTYFIRLDSMVRTDAQHGFIAKIQVSAYHNEKLIVTRIETMGV